MFMFFSLLAASVDGFVSGFVTGSMGIKFNLKAVVHSFIIIFLCCMAASVAGSYLARTQLGQYINVLGVAVMLFLGWTALSEDSQTINRQSKIAAISLAVAADASVACLYLAMCGDDIWVVSAISAGLHCGLMALASAISHRIIKQQWLTYMKYISAAFFIIMAFQKLIEL